MRGTLSGFPFTNSESTKTDISEAHWRLECHPNPTHTKERKRKKVQRKELIKIILISLPCYGRQGDQVFRKHSKGDSISKAVGILALYPGFDLSTSGEF